LSEQQFSVWLKTPTFQQGCKNETTNTEMNYPQNHEQSPRQAGAWRSQKERQTPAWPLMGCSFLDIT